VDHLIVRATEHQKKFRYELTINNAEDFLKRHRNAGLRWEPIGAVQGWDADSYAKAAAKYVKMGYRYLGLGGLVRTSSQEILEILAKVHEAVPRGIGIHLFGLARLKAINAIAGFGVTSVDSASALRRAWLGSEDNYWSQDGRHYRAIRVPEAGKSFRAKRMVTEGRATSDFVKNTERRVMAALRELDRGRISVEATLRVIGEYDHLITSDRSALIEQYRRTLESAPWKKCPCVGCLRIFPSKPRI
jgi:queuine/archaeosine tRNA-ribosyltransferase